MSFEGTITYLMGRKLKEFVIYSWLGIFTQAKDITPFMTGKTALLSLNFLKSCWRFIQTWTFT